VADIGSGTGIESIVASLAGASHVDAVDISEWAVYCTAHNVQLNGMEDCIDVCKSNLFEVLQGKKYDLIIANLPIVNFHPKNWDYSAMALYDPDFQLHHRLFREAKDYLRRNGTVTFTHADLQGESSFERLERMISEYSYDVVERREKIEIGYVWRNYKITPVTQ
jgi:methylase of polypeptide subunit release factors